MSKCLAHLRSNLAIEMDARVRPLPTVAPSPGRR